jgi:hypothetical protein
MESAVIGGVAAIGSIVGGQNMVAQALDSIGILSALPSNVQGAAVVFAFVFTADMIYNLFIA